MIKYISTRLKQMFLYFFGTYNKEWNLEINKCLKPKELLIFYAMDRYDKIHSYDIFKKVKASNILGEDELYIKLALLHDCGKNNLPFISRMFNIIRGRISATHHCEEGFTKLKEINLELATLIKIHHDKTEDEKMIEFQLLDSE